MVYSDTPETSESENSVMERPLTKYDGLFAVTIQKGWVGSREAWKQGSREESDIGGGCVGNRYELPHTYR